MQTIKDILQFLWLVFLFVGGFFLLFWTFFV